MITECKELPHCHSICHKTRKLLCGCKEIKEDDIFSITFNEDMFEYRKNKSLKERAYPRIPTCPVPLGKKKEKNEVE